MATEQTAQAARAEAGAVAGKVKEETKNVAQQAQQQANTALHQVQSDVRSRANEEASKFAQTLRDTSRQLQSMAGAAGAQPGEEQGLAARLVQEGSTATDRLATRIDEGGIDALLADVRSWARRQPAAFLLGAAAAGFVTGRLVRNLSGSSNDGSSNTGNGYRTLPASAELSDRLDPGVGIGGAE